MTLLGFIPGASRSWPPSPRSFSVTRRWFWTTSSASSYASITTLLSYILPPCRDPVLHSFFERVQPKFKNIDVTSLISPHGIPKRSVACQLSKSTESSDERIGSGEFVERIFKESDARALRRHAAKSENVMPNVSWLSNARRAKSLADL